MIDTQSSSLNSLTNSLFEQLCDEITDRVTARINMPVFSAKSAHFQNVALKPIGNDRTLAGKIDHTFLKPDATAQDIDRVCKEARENGFATVCVNSSHVAQAALALQGSDTVAISVVGFPLGAGSTSAKAFEASEAIRNGAREIDMVLNIGALKAGDYETVAHDIQAVVRASAPHPVKVILETCQLTLEQKIIGCALSKAAGAHFVKTSTGFSTGGATVEDIQLMRKIVGPTMGVKASGGIKTFEDAQKMIAAGANRIGASSSVSIVHHAPAVGPQSGY